MSDHLRYAHVARAVMAATWAIQPEKMAIILDFMAFKQAGGELSAEEISARLGAQRDRPRGQTAGDVAVMPVLGTISHRMSLLSEASGGTSVEALTQQFRALMADPSVSAIVLDVDSPGGDVAGIDEFAAEVYRARNIKPVTAVANALMASAAYWIGSAAGELVATPSAQVGSIGVIAGHQDESGFQEKLGVKTTLVSAGKYKAENNPFEPITDEGRAAIQARVDDAYGRFTKAVARGRGVGIEAVRSGFGEGRIVPAGEAVQLGMADRVATIDEVVSGLLRDARRSSTDANGSGANAGLVSVPYEERGQLVSVALTEFVQATRDRIDARRAEGQRTVLLSAAQRSRLDEIRQEIAALLDETQPIVAVQLTTRELYQLRSRLIDIDLMLADAG